MMLEIEDGKFAIGPFDQIRILHHVKNGTYHAAFFEERPFPGPLDSRPVTRVVCKMSHTTGAPSLDGAKQHVAELRERLIAKDEQVILDPVEWSGADSPMLIVPTLKARKTA